MSLMSFCNVCELASYLRYMVLTSLRKDEAAAHCCDPALSVLQVLVIVLTIYFLWLTRFLENPTLAAFIVCDPSQFLGFLRKTRPFL